MNYRKLNGIVFINFNPWLIVASLGSSQTFIINSCEGVTSDSSSIEVDGCNSVQHSGKIEKDDITNTLSINNDVRHSVEPRVVNEKHHNDEDKLKADIKSIVAAQKRKYKKKLMLNQKLKKKKKMCFLIIKIPKVRQLFGEKKCFPTITHCQV